MDGHRNVDAVTDASLDREIESILAVEPSPEFLARVRTRVAEEPGPSAWRWRWTFAFAGVAVAMIVAVVVWQARQTAPSSDAPVQTSQLAERVTASAPAAVEVEHPRTSRRAAPTIRARETVSLVPLISADDARAFDMLLSTIRQDDVVLVLRDDMPDSALSASALAVAPITIEPVPVPEPLEGGVE
jgi:hypothetical protein